MLNIKLPSPLAKGLAIATLGIGCPLMLYASTFPTRVWCDVQQNGTSVTATPIGQKSDFYWFLLGLGITQGFAAWQLYNSCRFGTQPETGTIAGELEASTLQEVGAMPSWTAPVRAATAYTVPVSATQPIQNLQTFTQSIDSDLYNWVRDLLGYPCVLIWGPQGAGKTSAASWLVAERIKLGHKIRIFDPHREYGQWAGLDCVGDGMNYEAIDRELGWFTKEIKRRYQERANSPNYQPQLITVLCDEFTSWADRCENAADFFRECLSDIRKIGLHVIFVSHARTLPGLGGAKGLAATRDAGLLELELEATVDPVTKKAVPKLQGKLKYPGATERETVALAPWMKGQNDFRTVIAQQREGSSESVREGEEPSGNRTAEPEPNENRTLPQDKDYSDSEQKDFEVEPSGNDTDFAIELGLESDELKLNRINQLKAAGLNQEQIILAIWGAKKGGSKAYRTALDEYKRLTHEG